MPSAFEYIFFKGNSIEYLEHFVYLNSYLLVMLEMLGKVLLVAFYGTSIKDQDEKLRRCTNFFIKAMQHITHVAS